MAVYRGLLLVIWLLVVAGFHLVVCQLTNCHHVSHLAVCECADCRLDLNVWTLTCQLAA